MDKSRRRRPSPPASGGGVDRLDAAASTSAEAAAAATAAASLTVPRSEVVDDLLFRMGFPRAVAAMALRHSDGTIDGALDWLAEREEGGRRVGIGDEQSATDASMQEPAAASAALNEAANEGADAKAASLAQGSVTRANSPSRPAVGPWKPVFSFGTIKEPPFPGDPPELSATRPAKKSPPAVEVTPSSDPCTQGREDQSGRELLRASAGPGLSLSEAHTGAGDRIVSSGSFVHGTSSEAFPSLERRSGRHPLERQVVQQTTVRDVFNRSGIGSDEADTVMTPVAHAVVLEPDEERGGVGIGDADSVVLATPAPPVARTRWMKIGLAVLSVCVVAIGLAFGLMFGRGELPSSTAQATSTFSLTSTNSTGTTTSGATLTSPTTTAVTMTTTTTRMKTSTSIMPPTTTTDMTTTTLSTTTPATTTTTTLCTNSSTTSSDDVLKAQICCALPSTCDDLSTEGTPQFKALNWTVLDSAFESYPDWRRIQRYVLAVVAFSLEGWGSAANVPPDWRDGAEDECSWIWGPKSWDKILCDASGRVTQIGCDNDIVATEKVPRDVALLSASLEILGFCCFEFSGTIPTELGMLSKMKRLSLDVNKLTGAVPTELGLLRNLQHLYLSDNKLTGKIPSELGLLSNLETLQLDENELSGMIPTELGLLSNLETLWLESNDFTGSMPGEVCDLRMPGGRLKDLDADCKMGVQCDSGCCTDCF